MLDAEANPGSEDEDEADIRPTKRFRHKSPSPQLDDEEEMIVGIVGLGDEEQASDGNGDDDANNQGFSDDGGNEEEMAVNMEDVDIGGNGFGGGVDNGVISSSFLIFNDI